MTYQNNYSYFNKNIFQIIAFISIYVAIFLILTFIPFTGYIRVSILSFTTLPILIAFATYHFNFIGAMSASLSFGIGSFLRALTQGDPSGLIILPDISIISRILLGLSVYLFAKLLKDKKLWKFYILAVSSVIFNTFWITVLIYTHNAIIPIEAFDNRSIIVWLSLIYVNFLVEIAIALFLAFPFYKLYQSFNKKGLTFEQKKYTE